VAMQAQDTFVAELKNGTMLRVSKGEVLSDSHELVKRDQAGSGLLFKPLDLGDEDTAPAKAKTGRGKAAADAGQ